MSEIYENSQIYMEAPFEIYSDKNKFYLIKPNKEIFSIEKFSSENCLIKESSNSVFQNGIKAYSLIGVLDAKINKYLIAVSKTRYIGNILTSKVFQIEEVC